jgi:AraC-like DNA-binding protein
MSSQQRKISIQAILRHGQLKQLSKDLDMSYSYLSQAFSPGTAINFTPELALKVEKALGLTEGQLDQGESTGVVQNIPRGLLALALEGRAAQLQKHFEDKRVESNVELVIGDIKKYANLIIYNHDDSVYMIAEQNKDYMAVHMREHLIMLMAISGAEYGVAFTPSSGVNEDENEYGYSRAYQRSIWYQHQDGKIINVESGPEGLFEKTGI